MEILTTDYTLKITLADLKEKPHIDVEELENEILLLLESRYDFKIKTEVVENAQSESNI